jgi:hypothetical protein
MLERIANKQLARYVIEPHALSQIVEQLFCFRWIFSNVLTFQVLTNGSVIEATQRQCRKRSRRSTCFRGRQLRIGEGLSTDWLSHGLVPSLM